MSYGTSEILVIVLMGIVGVVIISILILLIVLLINAQRKASRVDQMEMEIKKLKDEVQALSEKLKENSSQ